MDLYPDSPMLAEDVGDGRSALNAWKRLDHKHRAVSVAGAPPEPMPGEWVCGNLRASMYCRLAMLVNRGLIDLPPDEKLREELLAIEIERRSGKVFIVPKKWLKHRLQRSPDRADACAMVAGVSMPEEYDGPMLW